MTMRNSRYAFLMALLTILSHSPQETVAFTSQLQQQHHLSSRTQTYTATRNRALYMQKSSTSTSKRISHPPLLEKSEEQKLLRLAQEYLRLTKLKTELHLRSPSSNALKSNEAYVSESGYNSMDDLEQSLLDGRMARDTLITSNMGLVHKVTQQILNSSKRKLQTLTYDDLIQEGSIGLSRAIDKFKFGQNTKFGTYAYYWIRATILRALTEKNEYIRIPEHVSATVSKISKAVGSEEDVVKNWAWREVEEAKRLAESVGENLDKVDRAMEVEKRRRDGMVVLMGVEQQQWMKMDKYTQEQDGMQALEDSKKEELKQMLKTHLKPKEAEALSLRYGLVEADTGTVVRDYEAEAEIDLFGPGGILFTHPVADQPEKSVDSLTARMQMQMQMKSRQITKTSRKTTSRIKKQQPQTQTQPTRGKWGEAMTFKEVGKQMAISAENGRRLCSVGLEKLRAAVEEGKLDPALLY